MHWWESCFQSSLYSSQCLISKVKSLYIMHCFPFSSYITCNGTPEFELEKETWTQPCGSYHIIAVALSTAISPKRISKDCCLLTYDRTFFFIFMFVPTVLSCCHYSAESLMCALDCAYGTNRRKKTKKHLQEEEKWKAFLIVHVFPFICSLFSKLG